MNILVIVLTVILFGNAIMIIFKLFDTSEKKICFSFWAKLLTLQFFMVISIAQIYSLIYRGSIYANPVWALIIFIFSLYSVYAAFSFKYSYDSNFYYWFNGIITMKIDGSKLKKIIIYKKAKNQNAKKFGFVFENKIIRMRNDLGIDFMIKKYASENKIPIVIEN